jgi:hypothetical protein
VGPVTLTRRPPARHLTLLEPGRMTAGSAPHHLNPRARALLGAVARPELAGLAVCCGLAVVVFARAWASPTTAPNGGGGGDGVLFLWFLRWTPHALLEGLNPLPGTYLNVPDGVNLMWNTSLPLPAALMTPVTVHLGLPVTVTALYTLALACRPGSPPSPSAATCAATRRPCWAGWCTASRRR